MAEHLLEAEVAKLHGFLSIQSSPLKDVAFKVTSTSSNKAVVHIEVQSAAFEKSNRTLHVRVYPEVDPSAKAKLPLMLAQPLQLELFFPESTSDPPLLFGDTDAAARVAERVNATILPLERSSLMHALSVIISVVKQEVDVIWCPSSSVRVGFASEALSRVRRCPRSADLLLSLLSMSKTHHPNIRFPVPRFFYQDGAVDHPAILSAIASIPPTAQLIKHPTVLEETLPFQSCVLLNHLLTRLRVSLTETTVDNDPFLAGCFKGSADRPDLAFKVSGPDDMRFSELSTRGTRLAFHGSPPENFFSIVSLGLKNLSGTKGMRNGAAFGEGCYLAADLNVARQFAAWGRQVWRNSAFGADVGSGRPPQFAYQIIALCEFVDLPQYRKVMDNKEKSAYYVINEDHHLAVRALLLFKDPALKDSMAGATRAPTTATASHASRQPARVRTGNADPVPTAKVTTKGEWIVLILAAILCLIFMAGMFIVFTFIMGITRRV